MNSMRLDQTAWKPYFDEMSRHLQGKQAFVEIASLSVGDQVEADWTALLGIVYDSKDDLIEILLEGIDHMIRHPKSVYVGYGDLGLEAIEIIDGDDAHRIIRLRMPLTLPQPGEVAPD